MWNCSPLPFPGKNRVTHWNANSTAGHKQGQIDYLPSGVILISVGGYYYIYSQMYYHDGNISTMGHYTCIGNRKVMKSLGSVTSQARASETKYHGGVFPLDEGETISVRVTEPDKMYTMDSEASFFGAYLIRRLWAFTRETIAENHMHAARS